MASDNTDSSNGPPAWRCVEVETLQDCKVFTVGRATMQSPRTGEHHPFYRIDSADWVNVIALTRDDELVLVRQFRHGSREVSLEIPGGMVDPGEAPEVAAARELLEETGYRAGAVERVGSVNPNPALFGNRLHVYLATACEEVAPIENGPTEETQVALLPRAELAEAVHSGAIDHALVVAGLHLYQLRDQLQKKDER